MMKLQKPMSSSIFFNLCFESDNQGECREIFEEVNCNVHGHRIWIDPQSVTQVFKSRHTNKAAGPDNISVFLLKTFAEELTPVWHQLFQL